MPSTTTGPRWTYPKPGIALVALLLVATPAQAENDELRLPAATFAEATTAWRDGRAVQALALLDQALSTEGRTQSPPLEALVLRATLYSEVGRPADAEEAWREVIEREVWMRTFARRALVESLADRDALDEAEGVLQELTRSDPARHLDLMQQVAEALLAAGETSSARRLFRQMLAAQRRGPFADAARIGIADAWEQDGDRRAAMDQLREAKLQHWLADTFEAAVRHENRLVQQGATAPRPLAEGEYRLLVRRLRNASRFRPALALIDDWREAFAPPGGHAQLEAERITTLYVQRANEEAVAACQTFYEQFPGSPLIPDIRLTDFRLAVRMVDTERARRTGLDLWEGRIRGATTTDRRDAAVLLAAYLVAVGDISGGLDLYRELFQSSQSADDQRAFLWRAGVAALKDGQVDRALSNLRGLISRDPSGDLAPAGLYWLGIAESRANADAATRTFETVAQRFPYHYYGIRARERLERTSPGRNAPPPRLLTFPELSLNGSTTERAEYKAAMTLARAGRVEDAAWYLRRLLDRQRRDRGLALMSARASAEAGDYASVARILVNHFGAFMQRAATGLPEDFWQLVYPRPFWDEVSRAGRRQGVDPMLLFSLMRQESRFDPQAESAVGAVGLFQIMTYTAEALAERAGVGEVVTNGRVDPSALAQPAVNSAVAAQLMADLLEMFDGSLAPVVASYNAGEERVAVWWAASRELSEDLFVDTIPYSETRRFVREVLANRAAYERVYGTGGVRE